MKVLQLIIGVIANITSITFYGTPIFAFRKIHEKKSTDHFPPMPYICMYLSCLCWASYGTTMVDGLWIVVVNIVGSLFVFTFNCMYVRYTGDETRIITKFLFAGVMGFGCAFLLILNSIKHAHRITFGIMAAIMSCLTYAVPLYKLKLFVDRHPKYIPAASAVAGFFNGLVWTLYGFVIKDYVVIIPHVIGTVLTVIQILLLASYCKPKAVLPVIEDDAEIIVTN